MKLLVAAEDSGSLKVIDCRMGTDTTKADSFKPTIDSYCALGRSKAVVAFKVFEISGQSYTVTVRKDGSLQLYSTDSFELIHEWPEEANQSIFKFIFFNNFLYSCSSDGFIRQWDIDTFEFKEIKVDGPVDAFAISFQRSKTDIVFCVGGKEREVEVFKVSFDENQDSAESLFLAKNVKHDKLDLRVPIWVSNVDFIENLDASKSNSILDSKIELVVLSKYGHVRRYDSSHGRRPVKQFELFSNFRKDKNAIIASQFLDSTRLVYSDQKVATSLYDFNAGRLLGKFSGAMGSNTCLEVTSSVTAAGCLDRYVRVFSTFSREKVVQVYVGSLIACVHVLEDDSLKRKNEDDELWDELGKMEKKSKSSKKVKK